MSYFVVTHRALRGGPLSSATNTATTITSPSYTTPRDSIALVDSGAMTTATWPLRTERSGGLRDYGRNALATSVVLACRKREDVSTRTDRRGLVAALNEHLPERLRELQQGAIAPVDLAQAAIGPGMAVFTSYAEGARR